MRNIFPALFLFPILAHAASSTEPGADTYKASSSTTVGQGNFSEALALLGDHPTSKADDAASVDWSAAYTYARTPVGTSSNTTHTLDFSVGYRKDADVGAGFTYAKTPEEDLTGVGPNLWAGYIFPLGRGSKDEFKPTIEPKLAYHGESYSQTFGGTTTARTGSRRTVTRPTTGSESIYQNEYTLSVDVAPVELFSFSLAASAYKYNKDVARFIGLLDSPRAVSTGAARFGDTLGGFPKNMVEVGLTINPSDSWSVNLDYSRSKIQADGSTSTGAKIEAFKDLNDTWRVGLGFDHETSESQGQENLTEVDAAYSF